MKNFLIELLNQESLLDKFTTQATESRLPIALCGCGYALKLALEFLRLFNLNPSIIIDGDRNKQGTVIEGYYVKSYDDLVLNPAEHLILITPQDLTAISEIKSALANICITENIFSFDFINYTIYHGIQSEKSFKDFALKNIDSLIWLHENLCDEKSKTTLAGFISGRVTSDYAYYNKIHVGDNYFVDGIVNLTDDEIFVDCGAFVGDTIQDLIKRVGKYNTIYAFEADTENCALLNKYIADMKLENIRVFQNAVWNTNTVISFEQNSNMLSRVGTSEQNPVKAVRLDDVVTTPVTHIKMDIEGSEYEALCGAENLIRTFKPKLTICLYHKYEDLTRIPTLIKKFIPEYKLFLRHHTPFGGELILYAVP